VQGGAHQEQQARRGEPVTWQQPPDRQAERARADYDADRYVDAIRGFAEAIGELRRMYLPGAMTYRQPSDVDAGLVDGLTAAISAVGLTDPEVDVRRIAERACHHLNEIAQEAVRRGYAATLYEQGLSAALGCLANRPGGRPANRPGASAHGVTAS
jgi:hypothetical protein